MHASILCTNNFEGVSSSGSNVHLRIVIRRLLGFVFEHNMGNKMAVMEIPFNIRDFSSVRLPIQGITAELF
jgi:hypothetical protein